MLLYFDDPVSLTGCTIVPCSLVLSYATSYELVFECVTRNGEQPIDMEALGLSWSAVVTPSFSTTDKPLAKASIAADSVVGNKITVPIDTFSSNFYKYVAGRHAAPAVFSLRGYKIKDVESTCSASFQFWIQVQGRPNQDCIPDELDMLSTALEKEISDRMEADDLLQQEIDQLKDSVTAGGDMTKAVYDKNGNGIVDSAESIGTATAVQVEDAVSKAHEHTNKETLDKLGESEGNLVFDGKELVTDTSALEQAIATETQERKDADAALTSNVTSISESLSQESTTRAEADAKLTSDLEQSVSALQTADTETNQLLKEVRDGLERKIDTEISDRQSADRQLISSVEELNSTVSELDTAVGTVQESLTRETADRIAADNKLTEDLEQAVTGLQAADAQITQKLTETKEALEQKIATESSERKAADEQFTSSISEINGSVAELDASVGTLNESLAQETQNRIAEDSKLTEALAAKLPVPTAEGAAGQLLRKTADGTEWADMPFVKRLSVGTDFDTLVTPGEYYIDDSATIHGPATTIKGWVRVDTEGDLIRQTVYNLYTEYTETRQKQSNTQPWSSWKKQLNSLDLAAINTSINDKAPLEHTHEITDVIGLENTLQELQDNTAILTEADPAVDLQFEDSVLGTGWELNGTVNMLTFFDQVYQLQKLKLRVVSKDQTTTGNVVLVPSINDVEQEAVVVPVSAALTVVEVPVNGSGRLTLSRASEDARDTLKGEFGTVGMFITNIWKVSEL